MPRYLLVITVFALALMISFGCDDRGTNIDADGSSTGTIGGIDPDMDHVFHPQLTLQLNNPDELLLAAGYGPIEVFQAPFKPVPLLVLLAPEGEDKNYYFRAGLEQIAIEMTRSGEIQPMFIYCAGNDQTFGGYFYANSDPAGNYDSIVGAELITFLNNLVPWIIDLPRKRGIGGIGQGAYGAFRAALKHPGVFSSISVCDGPLDFDGSDNQSGLLSLFQRSLDEQVSFYNANPNTDTTWDTLWDTLWYADTDTTIAPLIYVDSVYPVVTILPFSYHMDFDSARVMPLSRMFMGGAMAFSPNDTFVDYTITYANNNISVKINSRERIADSSMVGGGDSTTYLYNVIKSRDPLKDFDFHLPFDSAGDMYAPIWSRWMNNNLENLHTQAGGSPLDSVSIWVGTNANAKWGYADMTQSWLSFLRSQNYMVEEFKYDGFSGQPVVDDEYLHDLIRRMLKFHSDNFGD